jgi:hypothetical protein
VAIVRSAPRWAAPATITPSAGWLEAGALADIDLMNAMWPFQERKQSGLGTAIRPG